MNKEEALKWVNKVNSLTPTLEERGLNIVNDKLMPLTDDVNSLEELKFEAFFCLDGPANLELHDFIVKKGEYYFSFDSWPNDPEVFGDRKHKDSKNPPCDDDVHLFLD